MPPKIPEAEKRPTASYSLDPENKAWVDSNYKELGYSSKSRAMDEAITLLRKKHKN